MIGRRSTIGLALLCAFAFSAFVAQSAMAEKGVHATNTTAVTCVFEGGNLDFEDAHCDNKVNPGEGDYGHETIANDTTTEIEVTTDKTKNNTTEDTPAVLNGTLAGVATEITCTKVKSVPEKSFIHNIETQSGKKHTVTGTIQADFTECTVIKPLKCKIKEPIRTTATFQGVEELGVNKDTMGVEFVGEGTEGTFAELFFENKSAEEKCSLTNGGKPFLVKGSAIGTGTPPANEKHAGATLNFNMAQTLEIGLKPATFKGAFTTTMAKGGNPIALTTTT